ncbi:hypothetical protein COA01_23325 [Bacillus cereus]|uniref:hypothetical protein n=1 Tax=Bacillus cereus TaxID=1396 RepID=UPI000BFB1525|nr:hypothetical protein [Bacillus cereus]PGP18677.1 hypothetical protein COA01_23325 [Bacillus cereus]
MSMILNPDAPEYQDNIELLLDDAILLSLEIPLKTYIQVTPEKQSDYSQDFAMKMVNYDKKNAVFTYPYTDERLKPRYNRVIFAKSGDIDRDLLPFKGYFNYLNFDLKELLFGIVQHRFRYDHVDLKEGDERFWNHARQWEKKEALMWDFTKEEFIDIPFDINQKHPNTQSFKERKDLINKVLSRLEELAEQFQDDLIDFYQLQRPDIKIKEYKDYLEKYKDFLENKLPLGLKLYFMYSSITLDEYIAVLEKQSELLEDINIWEINLNPFKDNENLTDTPQMFENARNFFDEFELFRTPRPLANQIEHKKDAWKQGYIGFDYSKMKLYPNIVEMERRRSRKEKATSADNELFIQKTYLRFLQDSGVPEPKKKIKKMELSEEKLEEIFELPKNLWNREITKLGKKQGWNIDKLLQEIKKIHDYAFVNDIQQ